MATKTMSPGAALLRTSRLFSLPAPLPPAPGDVSGASKRSSDTATLPFPTLQAIASPRESRARGDWGLKRPLPQRANQHSANPLVRIRSVDAIEGVTDYAMASDHTMTLRKWQAMNVPLTLQTDIEQRQQLAGRSVFEPAVDTIALDPALRHTAADKRWKFDGPWLAGITEGAFQVYLKKTVRSRRAEFREFLRAQLAADRNRAAAAQAMDGGLDAPPALAAADIPDADLTEYVRVLRHNRPMLYRLVGKFLDLAPLEPSGRIFQSLARSTASLTGGFLSPLARSADADGSSSGGGSISGGIGGGGSGPGGSNTANPWAQEGPPITHPSAGLSYLRTAAYLDNHPLYGPQRAHPPVLARILSPSNSAGSKQPKLGVAGFVASDNPSPFGDTAYNMSLRPNSYRGLGGAGSSVPGLTTIDPKIPGGAKVPMRVATAKVNSQGRVIVSLAVADPEAVLVQKEAAGQETIFGQPARLLSTRGSGLVRRSRFAVGGGGGGGGGATTSSSAGGTVISSPQTYGLGQ